MLARLPYINKTYLVVVSAACPEDGEDETCTLGCQPGSHGYACSTPGTTYVRLRALTCENANNNVVAWYRVPQC